VKHGGIGALNLQDQKMMDHKNNNTTKMQDVENDEGNLRDAQYMLPLTHGWLAR